MNTDQSELRFPSGLYGVTPDWDDAERLEHAIRQAASGGMCALQLRLKTVAETKRFEIAQQIRAVCAELGVTYIINDDWQLAAQVQADGVHLGRDDEDPFIVRKELGPDCLIGVSCYADIHKAKTFLSAPVDYIAFGAMFQSTTKPHASPAPFSVLGQGKDLSQTTKPATQPQAAVVAIGGITPETGASLIQAGADSLAVIGALFNAPNIEVAARQFSRLFANQDT